MVGAFCFVLLLFSNKGISYRLFLFLISIPHPSPLLFQRINLFLFNSMFRSVLFKRWTCNKKYKKRWEPDFTETIRQTTRQLPRTLTRPISWSNPAKRWSIFFFFFFLLAFFLFFFFFFFFLFFFLAFFSSSFFFFFCLLVPSLFSLHRLPEPNYMYVFPGAYGDSWSIKIAFIPHGSSLEFPRSLLKTIQSRRPPLTRF